MNEYGERNPVGLLNRLACCLTQGGMMASVAAVLTAVANQPYVSSGMVVRRTGLSIPNTIRLLNLLSDTGEVTFVREKPVRPDHPPVRRHYYVTPEGVATIRRLLCALEWPEDCRFRIPERSKMLNPVEMVHRLACCFTKERLMASQIAVLTSVVQIPSVTSALVVKETGLNLTNVIRILNYLTDVGDLTFIPERAPRLNCSPMRRHFYVTPVGISTVRRVMGHLGCGDFNEFRIMMEEREGRDLFRL